jgi:hypothetical protein
VILVGRSERGNKQNFVLRLGYVEDLFLPGSSRGRTVDKYLQFYVSLKNCSVTIAQWLYVSLKNISLTWRLIDLTDWLFIVLRPAEEFFTYMETSQLPLKGQIQAYARHSGPLRREGSLSCHTGCDTGLGFSGLIRRTAQFSRLLGHTRGCGGPILTRILTSYLHEEVTISCEGLQHLDLFSVLLWYRTSVFPVSSEGPPHL